MIAKASSWLSLFACVVLSLAVASIAHAQAPLRMIDRVHVTPQSTMQAQKDAIVHSIAQRTFRPRYGSGNQQTPVPPAALANFPVPHWTSSFRVEGTDYPFTVIGTDPAANQTTVVINGTLNAAFGLPFDPHGFGPSGVHAPIALPIGLLGKH